MSETVVNTEIKLGYGGSVFINTNGGKETLDVNAVEDFSSGGTCCVLATDASVLKKINIPTFSPYNMELFSSSFSGETEINNENRMEIIAGEGLNEFTGTLNFILTRNALNKIFNNKFISRQNVFDVLLHDGIRSVLIKCCWWSSISISSSARNLVTCSISFNSTNNRMEDFEIVDTAFKKVSFNEELLKYWETGAGASKIESFDISFSRQLTPVYLNTSSKNVSYYRVGMMTLDCNFSSWNNWIELGDNNLKIGDKSLVFKETAILNSKDFSFSGGNSTGVYKYSIKLYNTDSSKNQAWSII